MEVEVGKFYYYQHQVRKFKCIKVGTSKDKSQSDFVDYKRNGVYQFYNHDMNINKS